MFAFHEQLWAGLKAVAKDALMTKLIIVFSINSFCNGGILIALSLFFSLAIEVILFQCC